MMPFDTGGADVGVVVVVALLETGGLGGVVVVFGLGGGVDVFVSTSVFVGAGSSTTSFSRCVQFPLFSS